MCKLFPILLICLGFSANLHEVSISNNAFSPSEITIEDGDTIRWTNEDSSNHTVTEDNGEWDSGTLSNGATFKQVFLNTDSLEYHCSIHTSMTGKVIVRVIVPFGFREEDWDCGTDGCVWENQNDPESSCNIGECNGYANGATRDAYRRFFRDDITCECEGNVCCDPNTLSCVALCLSGSDSCETGQPELGHKAVCNMGGYFRDPDRSDGDSASCTRPFGEAAAGVPAGEANVGGETGTAVGDSVCCGDDSVDGGVNWETVRNCSDSSLNDNCDNTSKVCCSYATSCVDQTGTTCHETGACYGPNIMGNSYCNDGGWEDPDESQDYCESCGYTWTGTECCGDDSSEFIEDSECVCSTELDCTGVCGGSSYIDQCGECDDNAHTDCYDLSLDLHAGANLISFPCLPDDVSVENIFAGCDGVIGEGVGAVNMDDSWIGSLTEVSQDDGYWVKVSEDTTIDIEDCVPVNYDADGIVIYDMHEGNNLISYPFQTAQSLADGLGDAAEHVYALASEGVAALWSSDAQAWVGSLTAFEGENGYWLIANENFSFAYNDMIDVIIRVPVVQAEPEEYRFTQSTHQAFFIIDSLDISGESIEAEDLIIAFNEAVVVGARYWSGKNTDVPAMGGEGSDETEGYCEGGDIITFKLLDASSGDLISLQSDSSTVWINMGISIINLYPDLNMGENLSILPIYYYLARPYPNPFNPVTNLQYSLPVNTDVELVIYDISGRQVQTLISDFKTAGHHSVNWNASSYPSGMYLVKMVTREFTQTQKVVLIK